MAHRPIAAGVPPAIPVGKSELEALIAKGKADPKYSLRPVAERLQALLGRPVPLLSDCVGPEVEERVRDLKPGEVVLLENLRYHSEEEANDEGFARSLAGLAEVYVDDAVAAAHRAHASIAALTRGLRPAAAGLLMARELDALSRIFERPERPLWAVLGGAKVSDKLALVEHLLGRVDGLLIGGGMAFTFLKSLGHGVDRGADARGRHPAAAAGRRGGRAGTRRHHRPPHGGHPRDPR